MSDLDLQLAKALDARDRASDRWDEAINRNGLGSPLNTKARKAAHKAEDLVDMLRTEIELRNAMTGTVLA